MTQTEDQTATEGNPDDRDHAFKVASGFMVSVKTKVRGGVHYERKDLETTTDGDAEETAWETHRRIEDKEEHQRASEVRKRARGLILKQTFWTPFAPICEAENVEALDAAIAEARSLVEEHNRTAQHTTVKLFVLKGEIVKDEAEAIASVTGEIKDLLCDMDIAIKAGDPKAVRELCSRARNMGRMMPEGEKARTQLGRAITAARKIARSITAKVEKGGEELAKILETANLKPINLARFTFEGEEDFETDADDADDAEEALPAIATQRFIDLDTEDDETDPEPEATPVGQGRFADLDDDETDEDED